MDRLNVFEDRKTLQNSVIAMYALCKAYLLKVKDYMRLSFCRFKTLKRT